MTQWQDLVKTALLGTHRAKVDAVHANSPLTDLLAQVDLSDQETALLTMAGIVSLHKKSGHITSQIELPFDFHTATHTSDKAPIPAQISRLLAAMLDGKNNVVLPEFLTAIHAAGFTISDAHLPNTLDKGMRLVSIRPLIPLVLGTKGQYLAAKNPAWRYATMDIDNLHLLMHEWRTTEPGKRPNLLRQVRAANPHYARQLLETTWRSEADSIRSQFIRLLNTNISMADEPFLETALDDRSLLVRQKACELLSYLSDSRLARRMITHTRGVLKWTPNQPQKISVRFPTTITNQMARDGILRNAKMSKARLRGRQLVQMITAVPLDHWTTVWNVSPAEIIKALPTTNWERTLTNAFTTATARQRNHKWAQAILQERGIRDHTARLVSILTAAEYEQFVQQTTDNYTKYPSLAKSTPLRILLHSWHNGWNKTNSTYFFDAIIEHMKRPTDKKRPDPSFNIAVRQFSKTCPPSLSTTAATTLTSDQIAPNWRKTATAVYEMLEFRQQMLREIEKAAKKRD
ncbi:MAG: hypothetical protein GY943_28695 [Chloroflexi bacterium]|nr:hypothetical protein [Chloroflexota bacterium]